MSDLSNTPSLTWSHAGGPGESAGMVWYGLPPATEDDVAEIKAFLNRPDAAIDQMSLVGRYDKTWNSEGFASVDERNPNGGEGSHTYETQKCGGGDNVWFAKDKIWYYTDESKTVMLKGIPVENAGAYYQQHMSDGYVDNVAGPEPGSPADIGLGDGVFGWNGTRGWYQPVG
jgi:hypothetical protein